MLVDVVVGGERARERKREKEGARGRKHKSTTASEANLMPICIMLHVLVQLTQQQSGGALMPPPHWH